MEKKTFLLMLLLAFVVKTNIQADTNLLTQEAGWMSITALPDNPENYYFAFVDQTRDLMLGFGPGAEKKQGTEYKTMIYYTCVNPADNKSRLWTIERMNGVSGYESKWAIRNASAPHLVLTGNNSNACFYRTMTETTPTQYSAVNLIYDADGYWLVQNGKLEGNNYLGPWNGGEFANGMEVALNKPNDGTRAGRFKLYTILRSAYQENEKEVLHAPLTPAWMLGHIVWEDNYNTQAKTLELISLYRDHDIPVAGTIIDSPWSTAYNDFIWNTTKYPDAKSMASQLKEWGVKPILWLTGNVNETTNDGGMPNQKCADYDEAVSKGYGINNSQPSTWWKGSGLQIDFTNAEASEWFCKRIDRAFSDGFYGLKVDQGEVYFGNEVTTSIGTMTNEQFRKYYYNAMFDYVNSRKPGLGGIIARPYSHQGGYHASIEKMTMGWCGDFAGDWAGMKKQINNLYQSAEAGYGVSGTEIGGFMGAKSSKQQLIRYTQFGAMTGCMINGGENGAFQNHLPWWHDNATADSYRFAASLHTELIPYLFSAVVDCHLEGGSIMKNVSYSEESHQLGSDLFTKAITSDNNNVSFTLPAEGEWIDFFTGTRYNGGTKVNRTYALSEFPLFFRSGSIVPLHVQTDVTGIGDASLANRKTFLIYPTDSKLEYTFHLPDGDGTAYHDVAVTHYANGTIHASSEEPMDFAFIIREVADKPQVTGAESWTYDAKTQTLRILVTGTNVNVEVKSISSDIEGLQLHNSSKATTGNSSVYDLSGRLLGNVLTLGNIATHTVYISNGRKFISSK